MKVYVFYYPDGYPSTTKVFRTKEAAENYRKEHPKGAFGRTWIEKLDLDIKSDSILDLNE